MNKLAISSENILALFEFVRVCDMNEISVNTFIQKNINNRIVYFLELETFALTVVSIKRNVDHVNLKKGYDLVFVEMEFSDESNNLVKQ